MIKHIFTTLFVLFAYVFCFAQKPPIKFGKVSKEELEMTHYELDSAASAVILCDYGRSYIDYGTDQFQVIHERTTRIKILTKDGYDFANQSFRLYKQNSSKEEYSSLKAFTYNLENGSIEKTKLDKSAIFEEVIDKNRDKVSFTMPAVKEGSVIEFTYKITSDFLFNYQGWQFQYSVPVVWSEYRAKFIQYYTYKKDFQGYLSPIINESSSGSQSFSVRHDATITAGAGGGRQPGSTETYNATYTQNRIVLKDIPAFVSEPNMTTKNDYISKISYELETSNFPNSPVKRYRGTWESLNNQFLEYSTFGKKLAGSSFLNKIVESIVSEEDDNEAKINKIHNYLINKVAWSERNAKYSYASFKEVLENGKGTSADINLLLANMLIKSGVKAEPVILSTRSHGVVKEYSATSNQFNYVVCKAWVGDQYILIDATEKLLPIGVLPERCLNNNGYTISKTNPGWTPLTTKSKASLKVTGDLTISESGELIGELKKILGGYSGLYARKKYFREGEEKYLDNVISNSDWELSNMGIENSDSFDQPFIESCDASIESEVDKIGDKIYLNPVIKKPFEENIYKLEERKYPVNYSSLQSFTYHVTFKIPNGYEVIEKPDAFRIKLPNNGGYFLSSINTMNNQIMVVSKFEISKNLFLPAEYPYLKAFYDQALAKMKEQIVLKKIM